MFEPVAEAFRGFFSDPFVTVFLAAMVIYLGILWIVTLRAGMQRINEAYPDQSKVIGRILLFVFTPLILPLAVLLTILAAQINIVLAVVIFLASPILLILVFLFLAALFLPEIAQWIISHLGNRGARILNYVSLAPVKFITSLRQAWGLVVGWLQTWLPDFPWLRAVVRPTFRGFFEITGLNREDILYAGANSPRQSLAYRRRIVDSLGKLGAHSRLYDLAVNPAVDIDVRMQAAEVLEKSGHIPHIRGAWSAIVADVQHPTQRFQAAERLVQHGWQNIAVDSILTSLPGMSLKSQVQAAVFTGLHGNLPDAVQRLKTILANNPYDARLRLRVGKALADLKLFKEAEPVIFLVATNKGFEAKLWVSQAAVKMLSQYDFNQSLANVSNNLSLNPRLRQHATHLLTDLYLKKKASGSPPASIQPDFVVRSWLLLAKDAKVPPKVRGRAAGEAAKLARQEKLARLYAEAFDCLQSVLNHPDTINEVKIQIAEVFNQLGESSQGHTLLTNLANDRQVSRADRQKARQILTRLHAERMKSGVEDDFSGFFGAKNR